MFTKIVNYIKEKINIGILSNTNIIKYDKKTNTLSIPSSIRIFVDGEFIIESSKNIVLKSNYEQYMTNGLPYSVWINPAYIENNPVYLTTLDNSELIDEDDHDQTSGSGKIEPNI